jgi:hypothetical protein
MFSPNGAANTTSATSTGAPGTHATVQGQSVGGIALNPEGEEVPVETEAEDIASISCLGDDERAQVRWSCVAGSSVSQGTASPKDTTFTTRGALAGVVTVSPREVTTYTVSCIKNKEVLGSASCKLKPPGEKGTTRVRAMVLSIAPESEVVRRGKRARLSWSSLRASSCTVYGEGLAAEGDVGEEETEPLRAAGTYVYTLECETDTGDIQTARTRVEVR